jgi:hypothetical protein
MSQRLQSRREFLSVAVAAAGAVTAPAQAQLSMNSGPRTSSSDMRPLVHTTDLFRPHFDADDHWDLAVAFALTFRAQLKLEGILIDNPQNFSPTYRDTISPDIAAVAQLNYLTNQAVPVTTGTIWPAQPGERVNDGNLPPDLKGVEMLVNVLKRASQPVAISIGGSCQDVAVAGKKEPQLFSEKCRGTYLNVGSGSQDPKDQVQGNDIETNVAYNRGAYAAIFDLPCPIYWTPCFDVVNTAVVGRYGAAWFFEQKDMLKHLSSRMQAYFAYVMSDESGSKWLSYLLDSSSATAAAKYLNKPRGLCCTAGFLHASGNTVTMDGRIVSSEKIGNDAVFEYIPIEVQCNDNGITHWQKSGQRTNRYIFRVRDTDKYSEAMFNGLASLLRSLP